MNLLCKPTIQIWCEIIREENKNCLWIKLERINIWIEEKLTYMWKDANKMNRIKGLKADLHIKENLIYDRVGLQLIICMGNSYI